jgi:type II secretory pathway predicted ATPase ExeA
MYLDFYRLREEPFGVTPNPAYLYPSRTHVHALVSLSCGINAGRGFLGLIAEPGLGKTTLLYQLLDQLRDSARTVFLFQTQCNSREFFEYMLSELGISTEGLGLVAMHNKLNEALFAEMMAGRRFVLVVDEAQNLSEAVLETVRSLSNYETQHTKLLQIVLAGQPPLAAKLAQPRLSQLRQRLAVVSRLEPLTPMETAAYVEHRLEVAGHHGEPLFGPEALGQIARTSRGVPRVINNICHSVLAAAHAEKRRTISAQFVREVALKLEIRPPAPPVAVSAEVRPAARAAAPALTYHPQASFPLARRAFHAAAQWRQSIRAAGLVGSLVVAGILWYPSLLRLGFPGQAIAAAAASISKPAAKAPAAAKIVSEDPLTLYPAAPQETGAGQVLTVMAEPGQSLKDVSLRYLGKFDYEIFEEIRALNPELKDPDHLAGGQLIRLLLPKGALRKGYDSAAADDSPGGAAPAIH